MINNPRVSRLVTDHCVRPDNQVGPRPNNAYHLSVHPPSTSYTLVSINAHVFHKKFNLTHIPNPKMTAQEVHETTNVVICGCGPTGALLSACLGRASVQHVVLEKEPDITTDPRGIALDEDGIRFLQGIGVYDKIFTEIGTCRSTAL